MSVPAVSIYEAYWDIGFAVQHRGIRAEARITCLRTNGLSARVTAPQEMRGLPLSCCHIPCFGHPDLRGYHWRGMITLKATVCLRRSLTQAIDLHMLMRRRGRQLRRRYRRHVSRTLAFYDRRRGPLYDREAEGRRKRELRRGLRAGMWHRQRHEALMKELREGRIRYDLLLCEARSRFRAETGVRFGLSPREGEIGLLFRRYRGRE